MAEEATTVDLKQKQVPFDIFSCLPEATKKHKESIGDIPALEIEDLLAEISKGDLTPIGTLGTKSITSEFKDSSKKNNVLKIYAGAGLSKELIVDILDRYPEEYQDQYRKQFSPTIEGNLHSASNEDWLATEIAGAILAHQLAAKELPQWVRPIDTAVVYKGQLIGHIAEKIPGEPLAISQIEAGHPEVWDVINELAKMGISVDTFEGNVILEKETKQPVLIDLELMEE